MKPDTIVKNWASSKSRMSRTNFLINYRTVFAFIVMTALFAAVFTSCDDFLESKKYTVRFNSNGGTPTPKEQSVKEGGKVSKPADPTRDGYSFGGWSTTNNETGALWNFETEVYEDLTLYARWAINVYSVIFNSNGGSTVPSQNVAHGSPATKPADPNRSGYAFDGWFNGNTEWDFGTPITATVTLTARWTAVHIVTFDSDGGSPVTAQSIKNGSKASKPADPTKTISSGLYLVTLTDNYNLVFIGWYNGDTLWDFNNNVVTAPITLKARWSSAGNPTRIGSVLPNDVAAAFVYVNANSSGKEEYALLLDANVMIGEQSMNSANVKLTIIGIGVERFITATASNGRLFSIDGLNANLTLEQNITLTGKSASTYMINVQRGNLTMREGSKITGHNGSGIFSSYCTMLVSGLSASFKMEGGEISGNRSSSTVACVYVGGGATCEMSGGSITGNNSGSDLSIADDKCTFRLSGSARIGTLVLFANNNTTRATVTMVGNYSGAITTLHLWGDNTNTTNVAAFWTNAPVIVNGTAGIISMLNNGGLGNFRPRNFGTGTSIRATHELNASGNLVLKQN